MRIKICGITRKEDARFAELAGADAIGVVMFSPSSPRSVTEEKAREIFGALGPFVTRVIVTHTRSDDDLKRILTLRPDAIQISHPFVFAEAPGARVLRVIGRGDAGPADCDAVIVDESMGAGRHFDRAFAKEIVQRSAVPVILAGGLTPENVGDAIREIRPYAVDVASGVEERPGIKDHKKIAAFIVAARVA
ncbi:MAG: phosphoribosylanthranilate isomerase [Methanoregula sp.]|uniref:phosphoribosylanthranilate isomerase n=1 Tax=Methanoregula sp. TaxID=2052170 RepID=UPI003BAE61D3